MLLFVRPVTVILRPARFAGLSDHFSRVHSSRLPAFLCLQPFANELRNGKVGFGLQLGELDSGTGKKVSSLRCSALTGRASKQRRTLRSRSRFRSQFARFG